MTENRDEPQYAPWYRLPTRHIVAVEHPGIVKNVDRAIKTLQGDAGISKARTQFTSRKSSLTFDIDTGPIKTKQQSAIMPTPRGSDGEHDGFI